MPQEWIGWGLVTLATVAVAMATLLFKGWDMLIRRLSDSKDLSKALLAEADGRYMKREDAVDLERELREELASTATSAAAAVSSQLQGLRKEFSEFCEETRQTGKETSTALRELAEAVREHIKYHKYLVNEEAQWNSSHSTASGGQTTPPLAS